MEIYETEEQQLEAIKNWWKKNGASIITGLAIGVVAISGYKFWKVQHEKAAEAASASYDQVKQLVIEKSALDKIEPAAQAVLQEHADSGYAVLTSLLLAKSYVDNQQFDKAIEQLQQAQNSNHDDNLAKIIRLRLARLLSAQGQHDAALAQLSSGETTGFERRFLEVKGDILVQQNKLTDARTAYQAALSTNQDVPDSNIQAKLNNLPSE